MPKESPKGISTTWIKHIQDAKEREEFEKYIANSKPLLERLDTILNDMVAEKTKTKEEDYNCPSWAYKQADINGFLRAVNKIKNLTKHLT